MNCKHKYRPTNIDNDGNPSFTRWFGSGMITILKCVKCDHRSWVSDSEWEDGHRTESEED